MEIYQMFGYLLVVVGILIVALQKKSTNAAGNFSFKKSVTPNLDRLVTDLTKNAAEGKI